MTDNDRPNPSDDELEARLREAFARASPPGAPESIRSRAIELAGRGDVRPGSAWLGRLPFAMAAMAVVLSIALGVSVVTIGRNSTTQGEGEATSTPSAVAPTPSPTPSPTPTASP